MNMLARLARRIAASLGCAVSLAAAPMALADTPIYLYKSFSGNVNFAGTQVTIRDRTNGASPCAVSAESVSQSASLSMPTSATVVSAHLYWAGSGTTDSAVYMNGKAVAGDTSRSYTSATIGGGFDYFSVAADVTAQVKAKGAGNYTFSGLKVATGSPWCERSAVLGGFALVVVYSHRDQIYRTLNLYEGLRALLNSEQRVDMSNFRVPPNVTSSSVGRFGHLVWEGDVDIAQNGESLTFHGVALNHPSYAPPGNNYNSKSSVNDDNRPSLGIDYDSYSLTGWPVGLSSVSAVFRTGGDMVLLNAAVLAVPSSPSADLSVDLVRNTELRAGSTATYTATVINKGPGTEPGPTRLSFTLPTGLSYSSFTGSNWSCAASGATVTCTFNAALNNGAKTVLTLNVLVASTATGSKTTVATVTGNNDPGTTNNQDSDTATVAGSGAISFEYTARACTDGELVGGNGPCPLFAGPVYAGERPTIYLTAVDSTNRARTPSSTSSTTISLELALGCVNPSTSGGVRARYGGIVLPLCVKDTTVASSTTAWTAVTATFAANEISIGVQFRYLDAGAVKLYVRTTSGAIDFVQFVSMPHRIGLTVRNQDGESNPQTKPPTLGLAQPGFVRAGEPFTIEAKGLSILFSDSSGYYRYILPNFGKEEGESLRPTLRTTVTHLDVPASNATGLTTAPLEGEFPASGAFVSNSFSWSDIGSMTLRLDLDDYLGTKPAAFGEQNVGRFYPAYFSTYTGGAEPRQLAGFACLTRMNCPIVGLTAVKGAAYSNQPFDVTVLAHDEFGKILPNFDHQRYPSLVPTLTLTAVDAPGAGTAFGTRISPGLAAAGTAAANATTRSMKFGLGTVYDAGAARAAWLGPTAVYLRATAADNRMGAAVTLSSVKSDVDQSEEGGIMVVNGRLSIASVIGSALTATPVPLQAQYWNGSNWENNTAFDAPTLLNTNQAQFTSCQGTVVSGTAPNNCDSTLVRAATTGALALAGGAGRFVLAPFGAGQSGRARIRLVGADWLPSMFGQVNVGAHRSPVIYIREMY